jgi:hypothetical protein
MKTLKSCHLNLNFSLFNKSMELTPVKSIEACCSPDKEEYEYLHIMPYHDLLLTPYWLIVRSMSCVKMALGVGFVGAVRN